MEINLLFYQSFWLKSVMSATVQKLSLGYSFLTTASNLVRETVQQCQFLHLSEIEVLHQAPDPLSEKKRIIVI